MDTTDFVSREPVPVPDATKDILAIDRLTKEISQLFATIKTQKRLVREQQLKVGGLLMKLREMFGVKNKKGGFVGSHRGTFCSHIAKQGWNLGTVYNYISLVDGKMKKDVVRIAFWQQMNTKMKKATPAFRVTLLKQCIGHLVTLYKIPAAVVVTKKSA